MSRLLGVIRLSRDTEESTSPDRQRAAIMDYAAEHGHTIIGWAEDIDVSGSVSPFDRPGLGPWLTPEGARRFDVLCAWKLDRLSRRLFHTFDLLKWAEANDKTVGTVKDPFDLSTHWGRAIIALLAAIAEGELEAIRERSRGTRRWQREVGVIHGGKPPYGYRSVKNTKPTEKNPNAHGYVLEIDQETAPIVRRIIDDFLAGKSTNGIAQALNAEGVLSPRDYQAKIKGREPKGQKWTDQTIRRMLTSRALLGQVEHDGQVVVGDDGLPLQRAEPLITREQWGQIQLVISDRARPKAYAPAQGFLLSGVGYCECGQKLYCHWMRKPERDQEFYYYRCSGRTKFGTGCPNTGVRAEIMDEATVSGFLGLVGDLEIIEKVFIPGTNYDREIREAEESLTDLLERTAGKPAAVQKVYAAKIEALEKRLANLAESPATPDRWVEQSTGRTYRQHWESLSTVDERRQALLRAGIRPVLHAKPVSTPGLLPGLPELPGGRVSIQLPDDLAARVQGRARALT